MLTALSFIFTLGLLVTIHEYGHYIVARWFNVKVLRFSVGFGKAIWQTKFGKDQTELTIAAIPLGGYVKMLDERELTQAEGAVKSKYSEADLSRSFNRLAVGKRMAIVLAGPIANLLLAILFYWILFSFGVVGLKPQLGEVAPATPAAMAGFSSGDTITKVNHASVNSWQEVRWALLSESTSDIPVRVEVTNIETGLKNYHLNVSAINQEDTKLDLLLQLGLNPQQPSVTPIIGELSPSGVASLAGIKSGDRILKANNEITDTWLDLVTIIRANPNQKVSLLVARGELERTIEVIPAAVEQGAQVVGKIGAGVYFPPEQKEQYYVTTHYSTFESLVKASKKTWETSIFSLKMMGNMLLGNVSWKMMSGPVTIANYAGQSANLGIKTFIGFLALMSISIGVINLLPIPVLDGGHFMYYMIEFLTGKPVSESAMMVGQKIGLTLIAGMMMLAFYNDINRFITG
jgi:regulator of sigma E protease